MVVHNALLADHAASYISLLNMAIGIRYSYAWLCTQILLVHSYTIVSRPKQKNMVFNHNL